MQNGRYWEDLARRVSEAPAPTLWRRYCDILNAAWLQRWLPSTAARRVLKTDLFDEALDEGLYPQLETRAESVMGLDLSPSIVAAARSRHPALAAAACDARRLAFQAESLDVIVSNSTLDHLNTTQEILHSLREFHRVLRPGGWLLLSLDNLANPIVWLRNSLPISWLIRLGAVPYRMGATLGPAEARRFLRLAGFEVHQVEAFMHCPRLPAVVLGRGLKRIGGRRAEQLLLTWMLRFEGLCRWPTRFLTGYFIVVRARKPS